MAASMTHLPVLGVPVQSAALAGVDSLLSIVQMPAGVPVGTLAIGRAGAINAAAIATDAIDSDAIAASAVTEIQSGLATAAALATVDDFLDTEIAAILADAIAWLVEPPPIPTRNQERYDWVRNRREAASWVLSDSTRHIFSFLSICDVLDLEAEAAQLQTRLEGMLLERLKG
jgi:hypothetical protein